LVSDIASDPLASIALWGSAAALIVTAVLLVAVVLTRIRLLRRLALDRRAAALWNPLLAQCAYDTPASLPKLRARDRVRFLLLWCHAQESLRGEVQEHLREMARRLDVETHARRLLGSNRLPRRLLAVVALGHLRARDFVRMLATQVSSEPTLTSLIAAKALVRLDAAFGVGPVLAAAAARADWPTASVANILSECDPKLVASALSPAIRRQLESNRDGAGLPRLLRLHRTAERLALRSAELEVLAAGAGADALAATLANLWHPDDVAHARRLLDHPEWFVRVAAARALGRLGTADDAPRLTASLADRSWWVRYRAAQALCGLATMDASALDSVAAGLTDPFARDMLRQARAERSLV
jgi:hypothetical protein